MAQRKKSIWLGVLVAGLAIAAAAFTTTAVPRPAQATTPPDPNNQPCGTDNGLGCHPQSDRVDLYKPVFSHPTKITNPLFPVSNLHSVVMVGEADGEKLHIEATLLPETRMIDLGAGKSVETRVVQFMAFTDGRIHEVALDHYAQDDLGAVWYLGEDVFNYEDGVVADTEGTWLAGRDGPAAMIMPAHPQLGDVYRSENAPGFVFEEVVVTAVGLTVDGPSGPVHGAITLDELHMDGTHENKTFAPGYGEFISGDELLALAVPTDALGGTTPYQLRQISADADELVDIVAAEQWSGAAARLVRMTNAWNNFKQGDVPPLLEDQMDQALGVLADAIAAQDAEAAGTAAIGVGQASQDLQLRYKAPAKIDRARFELWGEQLLIDVGAEDVGAVKGDVATLEWILDRFAHTLEPLDLSRIDRRLDALRTAADSEDLAAAARAAERLLDALERAR